MDIRFLAGRIHTAVTEFCHWEEAVLQVCFDADFGRTGVATQCLVQETKYVYPHHDTLEQRLLFRFLVEEP